MRRGRSGKNESDCVDRNDGLDLQTDETIRVPGDPVLTRVGNISWPLSTDWVDHPLTRALYRISRCLQMLSECVYLSRVAPASGPISNQDSYRDYN